MPGVRHEHRHGAGGRAETLLVPEVPGVSGGGATAAGAARPLRQGVIKREAILDAALEVFSQVGFQGSTLREIARKCGVSHQSLMHYFPSKQELLIAVLHRRDERLRRHFREPTGMAVEELISLAEYNASAPGHIELFSTAAAEATAAEPSGARVLLGVLPRPGRLHRRRSSGWPSSTAC